MIWQSSPYIELSSVTVAIALNLIVYAWSRRRTLIGKAFITLMAAVAFWSLTTILQLCSESFAMQAFWHKLLYPWIASAPVAWFVFILIYSGRDKYVTRRNLMLLSIVPFLTMLATFTNDIFHFMFSTVIWDTDSALPVVIGIPNFWFWIHALYCYSILALGVVWLVKTFITASPLHRKQVGVMLVASVVPFVANIFFVLGPEKTMGIDPTPAMLAVTGLAAFWGLMRFQLLDIMPAAQQFVIRDLHDGIIVADANFRVVDVNPAAQKITGYPASIVGRPLAETLPEVSAVSPGDGPQPEDMAVSFGDGEGKRYFKIHVSPLYDQNQLHGYLVLLYDVTAQKKNELTVEKLQDEHLRLRREVQVNAQDRYELMMPAIQEIRSAFAEVVSTCDDLAAAFSYEPYLSQIKNLKSRISVLDQKTGDFTDYLKSDFDTIEISPAPFDLLPVLKQHIGDNLALFLGKGCVFTVHLPDSLPTVLADAARIQQVVSVLINTVFSLAPKEGRVALHTHEEDRCLWTEVMVGGLVIPDGEQAHLFDPFITPASDGRHSVDFRVGLALAKKLVELNGGTLTVESNPDRGTKFSFSLPLAPAMAEANTI